MCHQIVNLSYCRCLKQTSVEKLLYCYCLQMKVLNTRGMQGGVENIPTLAFICKDVLVPLKGRNFWFWQCDIMASSLIVSKFSGWLCFSLYICLSCHFDYLLIVFALFSLFLFPHFLFSSLSSFTLLLFYLSLFHSTLFLYIISLSLFLSLSLSLLGFMIRHPYHKSFECPWHSFFLIFSWNKRISTGGEEITDDVCKQTPEQAEPGGDWPRQPVLRRRLPLPPRRSPRRVLRPALRVPSYPAGFLLASMFNRLNKTRYYTVEMVLQKNSCPKKES